MSLIGQNATAKRIATGMVALPTSQRCVVCSKPKVQIFDPCNEKE
jgi:hypothetical protein